MKAIEKRLTGIMQKYLLPAGYEFQKVQADFERLSNGKELFDRGALETLIECEDNNDRAELLEKFKHYALPLYDDVQSAYPEIRGALKTVIREAIETSAKPLTTPFGTFRGRTSDEVVAFVADIIDALRYVALEDTFDDICELFLLSKTDPMRERWIKSARKVAGHDLHVWSEDGPVVQRRLIEHIKLINENETIAIRPVLVAVRFRVILFNSGSGV